MRGRKPKLNSLKLVQGSRHVNHDEPQLPPEIPTCPTLLKGESRREWLRLVPQLHKAGLLTSIDRSCLAVYCMMWGRWHEAETKLQQLGLVVKSPNGYPMQSPYLSIANKSLELMYKYMAEFGLSPASRTRIKVGTPKKDDELSEFLKQQA